MTLPVFSLPLQPAPVALAAPQGLLHEALQTYLRAFPNIQIAFDTAELECLLDGPEFSAPIQALVLDAALTGAKLALVLKALPQRYPGMKLLVLVDGLQQQQRALEAGADFALLKGNLGEALRMALIKAINL